MQQILESFIEEDKLHAVHCYIHVDDSGVMSCYIAVYFFKVPKVVN